MSMKILCNKTLEYIGFKWSTSGNIEVKIVSITGTLNTTPNNKPIEKCVRNEAIISQEKVKKEELI